MYWLNKIVWIFLNPVAVTILVAAFGSFLMVRRRLRLGVAVLSVSLAFLWFSSTTACVCLLGLPLERSSIALQRPESLPDADVIVVLGGGTGKCDGLVFPDLFDASDRVWHAARIWKAGKASRIVLSGTNELASSALFLGDLGVPRSAIVVDNESRNTYENSRYVERLIGPGRTVLLVTSAWHMPRALVNFSKTSLDVRPAPCDFSANNARLSVDRWWQWAVPGADSLFRSNCYFKEWLGRLARK